ncbi:hypothetical protein MICRO8M_60249 [Microbacterium sp. 8M]|nr:hypothetical protein MICRO8M_60249 [Microbacterium sp. 8M]
MPTLDGRGRAHVLTWIHACTGRSRGDRGEPDAHRRAARHRTGAAPELAARRGARRERRHRLGRVPRGGRRRRDDGQRRPADRRSRRPHRWRDLDGARRVRLGQQPARQRARPHREGAGGAAHDARAGARRADRALPAARAERADGASGRRRAHRPRRPRRAPRGRAGHRSGRPRQPLARRALLGDRVHGRSDPAAAGDPAAAAGVARAGDVRGGARRACRDRGPRGADRRLEPGALVDPAGHRRGARPRRDVAHRHAARHHRRGVRVIHPPA